MPAHVVLPMLLHHGLRFLTLVRRQHRVDLRFGPLFLDRKIGHDLRLFRSEGSHLGLIEGAGHGVGLGQPVLAELLTQRLSFRFLRLQNGLDLGLLSFSQIELLRHALEHSALVPVLAATLGYCCGDCHAQAGCQSQYKRSNREKFFVHH